MSKNTLKNNVNLSKIGTQNQATSLNMSMFLPITDSLQNTNNGLILEAKDQDKSKINVMLDNSLIQELEEIALKTGYSKDRLIEICLIYAKNNIIWA